MPNRFIQDRFIHIRRVCFVRPIAVAVVWTAVVLLAGCSLFGGKQQGLEAPISRPLPETANTIVATRDTISTFVRGQAIFVSNRVASLSYMEAGGRLKALNVELGRQVETGELLAELETDDIVRDIGLQRLQTERAQLLYREAIRSGADEAGLMTRRAELERERMALRKLEDRLERAQLRAPLAGTVTYVAHIQPGDTVHPYQVVATIADPTSVQLVYSASQPTDLIELEVGMPVDIRYQGTAFTGKVLQAPSSVPLRTDPQKAAQHNTRAIIGLSEQPDAVKVGHAAEVTITLQRRDNAIVVPRTAIRTFMGRSYVQLIERERPKEQYIETGLEAGSHVEIVKGVEEGQRIVVGN